jgi:hypothetical protein
MKAIRAYKVALKRFLFQKGSRALLLAHPSSTAVSRVHRRGTLLLPRLRAMGPCSHWSKRLSSFQRMVLSPQLYSNFHALLRPHKNLNP